MTKTTFGKIKIGGKFKFPNDPENVELEKVSKTHYIAHGGSGSGTKNRANSPNQEVIVEGYKLHYPSLKKLTQINYTDPRVNTEGRTIHVEKEGNFRSGENNTHGHYVVYEDKGMPGSYIGIHVGSEISEDSGEAPVSVIAMDTNRSTVVNRVAYRMRQSKIAEGEVVEEIKKPKSGTPDWHKHKIAVDTVKNPMKSLMGGPSEKEAINILKSDFGYTDKDIKKLREDIQHLAGITLSEECLDVVTNELKEAKNSKKSRIDAMREILKGHQHNKIEGKMVDAFSASAYVKIYDALSQPNRDKIESLPIVKAMDVVWKLINR